MFEDTLDRLIFGLLVLSLVFDVTSIAERLINWAAGGLSRGVGIALEIGIAFAIGRKARGWWDHFFPPTSD